MQELLIDVPSPFHFEDVVHSHGWLQLPPYHWDEQAGTLTRLDELGDGRVARTEISATEGGILARTDAGETHLPMVARQVRWLLSLDEDLAGFHRICGAEAGLHETAARGKGRILRCPTVWEDVVKTLFSVNTTWRQTVSMSTHLVRLYGAEHTSGKRAFPTPERLVSVPAEELQRECRTGYRAAHLANLARDVAEGRRDLEALKDAALPDIEVEQRLRSIPGIGPYAAANVMMVLGRHDALPVDSWFRMVVRRGWFPHGATDAEMIAAFERFRPYRALVYRCYDWDSLNGKATDAVEERDGTRPAA